MMLSTEDRCHAVAMTEIENEGSGQTRKFEEEENVAEKLLHHLDFF